MKAYELLIVNKSLLDAMEDSKLSISDVKHVGLINDYIRMSKDENKKTYIVCTLSVKYDIPERTVYRIIERLMKSVKPRDET